MTVQTLTPTQLVPDGAGLNLTSTLAAPTGVTLQFANTGKEFLAVAAASTAETVTVDIGALVEGQAVTNFTTANLTTADTYLFGPFHSVDDAAGTSTMQVTLSTTTAITVALIQFVGVI